MAREPRDVGASVRARLLERARAGGGDLQILLTRYSLERPLYRLSISTERDRFVLKGALLLATWVPVGFRATRDLDLLGHGDSDVAAVGAAFRNICETSVPDDGVAFDVEGLHASTIRREAEYGGVRVRTAATVGGAQVPIQVDVGFGDAITPGPIEIEYPTLLDFPVPRLRAYPAETVIAEKFEAMVALGMANSRMKDFYDLWVISQTFTIDHATLSEAVRRTFERRGTPLPAGLPSGLGEAFGHARSAQWRAFVGRERMAAAPEDFAAVLARLREFLMPLIDQP